MKKSLHTQSIRICFAIICFGFCFSGYGQATSTTTWTITFPDTYPSWDNGEPDATTDAIIAAPYISGESNITAYSLTITNNATLDISSGTTVTLNAALTVNSGSSVTFENNANLIQDGTSNLNSGAIIMKRNSSLLKRLDYTLWSSPVTGSQTLLNFSPSTLSNRFYTYTTNNNLYTAVDPSTNTFVSGTGYLIRMPNNHPASTPTNWQGSFTGVPNNGDYSFTMVDGGPGYRFNLVGNPYPSPLSAADFVAANSDNITGTLYFWRKTNNVASPSYCSWNSLGFTSNGEDQVVDLNDVIQIGQGFFVEGSGNGTALNFNNNMRVNNHLNQFFKNSNVTNTIEKNRIWLNATSASGSFSQILVGYVSNATQGYDPGIDGKFINDGDIALTSLIGTTRYAIQGRALPFTTDDVVLLNFKAATAGDYTIAIDHMDGIFAGGAQSVYLKDNLTNTIHNLNTGAYTFASAAGTFPDRFEVIYALPLGTENPVFTANNVIIYNLNNEFVVNTGTIIMSSIKVFDIRGRLIEEKNNINTSQTTIKGGLAKEVLLVQIKTEDGSTVTKKVIR